MNAQIIASYADGSGPYLITRDGDILTTTIGEAPHAEIITETITRARELDTWEGWPDYMLTDTFGSAEDAGDEGGDRAVLIDGEAYWCAAMHTDVAAAADAAASDPRPTPVEEYLATMREGFTEYASATEEGTEFPNTVHVIHSREHVAVAITNEVDDAWWHVILTHEQWRSIAEPA